MAARLIPLADDARTLLRIKVEDGAPLLEALTPAQARANMAQAGTSMAFPSAQIGKTEDITIEGPGGPLCLRLYRPKDLATTPTPALLFFHGGGWMLGNLESHDDICRRFCFELGFPVVAVDYRLAPEHPFPAAVEDAFAAARWLFAHSASFGLDPARIAVGGDSAGGNLAAVAAIAAARGDLPAFAYQLLCYPITDLAEESPGYERVADGVPINAMTMRWFRNAYLAAPGDRADWRASPLRAPSLVGCAPAFVMTTQHDPSAEEGAAYARRLAEEGVMVTHLHYSHHLHAMLSMGALIREATAALTSAAAALKAHFAPASLVHIDAGNAR